MMIRPATRSDILEMMGETYPETMRAITAVHDGRVLAIAGVRHGCPITAFSNIAPEIKEYPRTIIEMIRQMRVMLNDYKRPVYALADMDEVTAPGFLKHIGFKHVGTGSQGEIYEWQ
jgi:hypothetical protein